MHSIVSLMSFIREIWNVYKRNQPQGVKFIFHIQFGNGSPTVRQFYARKIKNLISYLYTKLLYLCLYVGKTFIMQIRTYNNLTILYNEMKIKT